MRESSEEWDHWRSEEQNNECEDIGAIMMSGEGMDGLA